MVGISQFILRIRRELFFIFYTVKQVKDCLWIMKQINWFYHLNERHYKVTFAACMDTRPQRELRPFLSQCNTLIWHVAAIFALLRWISLELPTRKAFRKGKDINTQFTKRGPVRDSRKKKLSEKWFSLLSCPNNLVKTSNMQRKILNRLIRLIK